MDLAGQGAEADVVELPDAEQREETGPQLPGAAQTGLEADFRALAPRHQRRLILEQLRAGRSDLEIGARLALSQWQVRNLRYRLGLKKDRGGHVSSEAARAAARRGDGLERQLAAAAARVQRGAARVAARARRLPRVAVGDGAGGLALRLAGRLPAAEAGRRLVALGGLLAAAEGDCDLRVAVQQLQAPSEAR